VLLTEPNSFEFLNKLLGYYSHKVPDVQASVTKQVYCTTLEKNHFWCIGDVGDDEVPAEDDFNFQFGFPVTTIEDPYDILQRRDSPAMVLPLKRCQHLTSACYNSDTVSSAGIPDCYAVIRRQDDITVIGIFRIVPVQCVVWFELSSNIRLVGPVATHGFNQQAFDCYGIFDNDFDDISHRPLDLVHHYGGVLSGYLYTESEMHTKVDPFFNLIPHHYGVVAQCAHRESGYVIPAHFFVEEMEVCNNYSIIHLQKKYLRSLSTYDHTAIFFGLKGFYPMFKTIYHGVWETIDYNPFCQYTILSRPAVYEGFFMILVSNNKRIIDRVLRSIKLPAWAFKIAWITATTVSWYGKEQLLKFINAYHNAAVNFVNGSDLSSSIRHFTSPAFNCVLQPAILKDLIFKERPLLGSAGYELSLTVKSPITESVREFHFDKNFDIDDYTDFRMRASCLLDPFTYDAVISEFS